MTLNSETMLEIWTRHYDSLTEEKRVSFLLTLKIMKYQGKLDASEAFSVLSSRWIAEPPNLKLTGRVLPDERESTT